MLLIVTTHAQSMQYKPKIVNIVNFIRLLEPRDSVITKAVLFNTVVKQLQVMRDNKLGGTFLLQYDALLDTNYQVLLKNLGDSFEIGAWWEIPQPLVETAGLAWRGRYPWDWHADVGFSTGYTPAEREKLVDVYMNDFKKIFGYYPKSAGSWFIDAHTLNYMYNKYHIVASCNCKDQYGTDGYTLWGGYWNQAYYPSKINSYMPAQHKENQTPVPVFRMLGSDPVRQYDNGLGSERQGVITLEPVYPAAGGDSNWVHWFFDQFVNGECMEYNYAQAGQENSFTWDAMAKGFNIQMPLIAKLRDEGRVNVQTLEQSGKWFSSTYEITPATSVTVVKDIDSSDKKSVWFNSRYYRANLIWEKGILRIRDIHMFNEDFPSFYTQGKATSNECQFYTLPVMDGYLWSSRDTIAGIRFVKDDEDSGAWMRGKDVVVESDTKGSLTVIWTLQHNNGTMKMHFDEKSLSIKLETTKNYSWRMDAMVAPDAKLSLTDISDKRIKNSFENFEYFFSAIKGKFEKANLGSAWYLIPEQNEMIINFAGE